MEAAERDRVCPAWPRIRASCAPPATSEQLQQLLRACGRYELTRVSRRVESQLHTYPLLKRDPLGAYIVAVEFSLSVAQTLALKASVLLPETTLFDSCTPSVLETAEASHIASFLPRRKDLITSVKIELGWSTDPPDAPKPAACDGWWEGGILPWVGICCQLVGSDIDAKDCLDEAYFSSLQTVVEAQKWQSRMHATEREVETDVTVYRKNVELSTRWMKPRELCSCGVRWPGLELLSKSRKEAARWRGMEWWEWKVERVRGICAVSPPMREETEMN